MNATGEQISSLPRPYEQFPDLSNVKQSEETENGEQYTVQPFDLPVISLPIETDDETVPASAKLPGSARSGPSAAPGETDDFAREPVGYSGLRAYLTFFTDDVGRSVLSGQQRVSNGL